MVTTVPAAFDDLQAQLALTTNQTAIAAARVAHLSTIVSKTYLIAKAPWTIGSYGRETIIRPERDIDVMAILDKLYWDRYQSDSRAFLHFLRGGLKSTYPNTRVGVRQIAIHLAFGDDLEVDFVPGFHRSSGGFLIPDGSGGWLATNPPFHDQLIADANVRLGGRLSQLVRVMKAWNVLSNARGLRSFHLEMMIERMWRNATAFPTMPNAVEAVLRVGGAWVRASFADPWRGSGGSLDSYLTPAKREVVARNMDDGAHQAKAAIGAAAGGRPEEALLRWNILLFKTMGSDCLRPGPFSRNY